MGGQKYFKYEVCMNPEYEVKKLTVDATAEELYYDWEEMNDEFGLIEGTPSTKNYKVYNL
ncbi:MAG: hypothetical protein GOVbin630_28 [Prokaryotic dsDNA virus sp.]|nr:MAG: hypothetical protein GOVbin630_28 [Prokaryotic dsDNA virus sp.]|tara:strand:- start:19888 stop:20067 length:180 start_codon:yes stop_codon:yes gene_type:complete